jgi:hypothetical protein
MPRTGVHPPQQVTTMGSVSETDVDDVIFKIEPVLARVDRARLGRASNCALTCTSVSRAAAGSVAWVSL